MCSQLLTSYEDVVDDYLERWNPDYLREQEWFGDKSLSLKVVIVRACLSRMPHPDDGRCIKLSHQRRIPVVTLKEASDFLVARKSEIKKCNIFNELHELVNSTILPIRGVGELLVYDVSARIGNFLSLEPDVIYLHAGTRKGAYALGLDGRRNYIKKSELPKEFHKLTPGQLENVLCTHGKQLAQIADSQVVSAPNGGCGPSR